MKKTPPGTRALIRKFLQDSEPNMWIEEEIWKRIGDNNAVLVDGKIVTANSSNFASATYYFVDTFDRISLDDEDDKIPSIETPFDNIEPEEEQAIMLDLRENKSGRKGKKKEKKGRKRKKSVIR